MSKEKKRTIGEVINDLSGKPMPFTLNVSDKKFELFIYPASKEALIKYADMADTKNLQSEKNEEADRYLIYECVKDAEGNKVWEKPEDVKIEAFLLNQLKNAITQRVFGLNLSEFATKNLQGSPSSKPVSQ